MDAETKIPLSDELSCKIEISAFQGNVFKVIMGKTMDKFCTFLAKDKIAYADVLNYSNLPAQGVCPIPPVTAFNKKKVRMINIKNKFIYYRISTSLKTTFTLQLDRLLF